MDLLMSGENIIQKMSIFPPLPRVRIKPLPERATMMGVVGDDFGQFNVPVGNVAQRGH